MSILDNTPTQPLIAWDPTTIPFASNAILCNRTARISGVYHTGYLASRYASRYTSLAPIALYRSLSRNEILSIRTPRSVMRVLTDRYDRPHYDVSARSSHADQYPPRSGRGDILKEIS